MTTDTTEKGLETIIENYLVEKNGYEQGTNTDYNKDYAIDETRLISEVVTGQLDVRNIIVPNFETEEVLENVIDVEIIDDEVDE